MDIINELSKKHNIHIIYTAIIGSRRWGLSNETSDHDLRFVYTLASSDRYLSLEPYHTRVEHVDPEYDIVGFELRHFMTQLKQCNPNALEMMLVPKKMILGQWSRKPISFREWVWDIIADMHTKDSLTNFYHRMMLTNRGALEKKPSFPHKKYFNMIRPALLCRYLKSHEVTDIPETFLDLVDATMSSDEPGYERIMLLVQEKQTNGLIEDQSRIPIIDKFIDVAISSIEATEKVVPESKNGIATQMKRVNKSRATSSDAKSKLSIIINSLQLMMMIHDPTLQLKQLPMSVVDVRNHRITKESPEHIRKFLDGYTVKWDDCIKWITEVMTLAKEERAKREISNKLIKDTNRLKLYRESVIDVDPKAFDELIVSIIKDVGYRRAPNEPPPSLVSDSW